MFNADFSTAGNRWHLLRLRAAADCEVTLLSRGFFQLTTHWVGHTVPCAGDGCELCETLVGRGLFYLGCMSRVGVSILELGAQSALAFEQHCKLLHGGMTPGLVLRLMRRTPKGCVYSEVIGRKDACGEVLAFDLCRRVMAVYKYPPPNVGECIEEYAVRCSGIARRRNSDIAHRLRAAQNGRVGGRS